MTPEVLYTSGIYSQEWHYCLIFLMQMVHRFSVSIIIGLNLTSSYTDAFLDSLNCEYLCMLIHVTLNYCNPLSVIPLLSRTAVV